MKFYYECAKHGQLTALPCVLCEKEGVGPSQAQAGGRSELVTIEHALRNALFPSSVGHLFHDAIKSVKALRDLEPSGTREASPLSEQREALAELCHTQWSGWMKYLFGKCEVLHDGEAVIPAWAVDRWKRQLATPYIELSEEEKESDRKEADRFIALLQALPSAPESSKGYKIPSPQEAVSLEQNHAENRGKPSNQAEKPTRLLEPLPQEGAAPAAPVLRQALPSAIEEQDALERLRDIRHHLVNIPPILRNQATQEAVEKTENHITDLLRRPKGGA